MFRIDKKIKPTGGKKADLIRHKGFYAALYSCVGAMLVLAVVIGYNNFRPRGGDENAAEDGAGYAVDITNGGLGLTSDGTLIPDDGFLQDSEAVDGNSDESYLTQATDSLTALGGTSDGDSAYDAPEDYVPSMSDPMDGGETGAADDTPDLTAGDGTDLTAGDGTDPDLTAGDDAPDMTAGDDAEPDADLASGKDTESGLGTDADALAVNDRRDEQEDQGFAVFDEQSDSMAWPVLGEIVMDFNVDHLIYDRTLEQYRTNDNVCIGAEEGTPVQAAAEGKIADIYSTRENGRTVTVEHGNGWVTTYSQLQDSVTVQVGDVVEKGQSIGEVGIPSIYSSQLGAHLEFTVLKDDVAVDPHAVLN